MPSLKQERRSARLRFGAMVLGLACILPAIGAEAVAQPVTHEFGVSRHTLAKLTNAEADTILAAAGAVLSTADTPQDTACAVVMRRRGDVGVFSGGTGIIVSEAQFYGVLAQPGSIHLVNGIAWCGKPAAGILGCAPIGGGDLAVTRYDARLEPMLWAHEFGHNQGLPDLPETPTRIMNEYIAGTARELIPAECEAMRRSRSATTAGNNLPGLAALGADVSVQQFIRRHYFDGVLFSEASRFTANDLAAAQAILANPEDRQYWSNAAGVIGAIGGPAATASLLSFIEQTEGREVDAATFRAGLSAMIGLGYAANKGDPAALNALSLRTSRLLQTPAPAAGPLRLDALSLNQAATLGLSLAGKPASEQLLFSLPLDNSRVVESARTIADRVKQFGIQGLEMQR